MKITRMKTNRIPRPLGFELGVPSLSWVVEDTSAQKQKWARVQVSGSPAFEQILWDSGRDTQISSIDCPVPMELLPRTRYWWKVEVCNERGETAVSAPEWFETAKIGEPWAGKWISPSLEKSVHPLMRRSFVLEQEPVSARIYATGLGLYELSVNGQKAGEEFLAPGCTGYDKWLQYQTYDVTSLLQKGKNTLGAMLGNGWAKGRFGFDGHAADYETGDPGAPCEAFCDRFLFLLELRVTLADGREVVLGTDCDWQCAPAPVTFSGLYDGERYEQALEIPGWDTPSADDFDWKPVVEVGELPSIAAPSPRLSLPVVKREVFHPTLLHTPKGEWVLDMGQEITGWFEMKADFPKGTKIRLQFGELLQEDCFYRDNLRTALCEYRFVSDGRPALVRPHFAFYGYRYIKVSGWPGEKPDESAFVGCSLYSDLEEVGSLETGNEKVNRLILNAKWSQKDNFVDVPTDCPQRDERMGWTGDAQVFSSTACFVMDCSAFYDKYCRDLWKEQEIRNGCVPHVAPVIARTNSGHPMLEGMGACGWADAGTIVPWNRYVYNGGKEKLREQFPGMKAWVDWVRGEDAATGNTRLWLAEKFHFGDWLALDGPRYGMDPEAVMGGTDMTYLCSVYYYRCAMIVSKAAKVLGLEEERKEYAHLAEEIRHAIQKEYFTPGGRCAAATQTGLVLALAYDLIPAGYEQKNLRQLSKMIEEAGMHLKTGFLGTPALCHALTRWGDSQTAYSLLLQEELPGWLYEVNMGATTIWERWNSVLPDGKISGIGMNSMNHYAYGSVVEWLYRDVCGLNPSEEGVGFQKVRLAPKPDARLGHAHAKVDAPAGRYESGWKALPDGGFAYEFVVPFHAEAELMLENVQAEKLLVNGVAANEAGISIRQEGENILAALKAGRYQITCMSE